MQGTFDGGNHKIIGLTSNAPIISGVAYGGVKNLARVDGSSTLDGDSSSFVGSVTNGAYIMNCYNSADTIAKDGTVGGITGRLINGRIENCINYGNVGSTTAWGAGGITGALDASNDEKEFIVVKNCHNAGNVRARRYAGGIAAWTLRNYKTITIRNSTNCGQIIGNNNESGSIIGKITPSAVQSTITFDNVKSLANVTSVNGGTSFISKPIGAIASDANTTITGEPVEEAGISAPAKPF